MQNKTSIDTCILIYLVDKTEPEKHAKAIGWFESIRNKKEQYFISMQNLREFAGVAFAKTNLSPEEINENISLFSETFSVLDEKTEDIKTATLLLGNDRKNFYDALLAATMQRHGIMQILTENTKDFEKIKGIKTTNPLCAKTGF